MLRLWLAIILLILLLLPAFAPGFAARRPLPRDAEDVFDRLTFASLSGTERDSVQSIATDADGNVYVTGTTYSRSFPAKNAVQRASGEARILRTTDRGASWTAIPAPPIDIASVVPDPAAPDTLFASGVSGIFKTTDAGQTWRHVYTTPPGTSTGSIAADPADRFRLTRLAADGPQPGTLLRSLDAGETWTAVPCGNACGLRLWADPSGSGALIGKGTGLWLSLDWGLTFNRLVPPGPGSPTTAAFDPSHPGWIYVDVSRGTQGSLFLTTDNGATWIPKASPPGTFTEIFDLHVDPRDPGTLAAATLEGLSISTDGASTWMLRPHSRLAVEKRGPLLLPGPPCAAGTIAAIGDSAGQVLISADYGAATWKTSPFTGVTSLASGPGCTLYAFKEASSDAFAAKFSSTGTLLWATYLGGSGQDQSMGLALDPLGDVAIVGFTASPDFPSTLPRLGPPGGRDIFLARLSAEGVLLSSQLLGGSDADDVSALAVDSGQNAYITGTTRSDDFPVTPGALLTTKNAGEAAGYLAKLSPAGTLVFATFLGQARPGAVLADANETPIVAGFGALPDVPQPDNAGDFVLKLDRSATRIEAVFYIDGTRETSTGPTGLAADSRGDLYVVGGTFFKGFQPSAGAFAAPEPPVSCGVTFDFRGDSYVTKLAASDGHPIYRARLTAACGIRSGNLSVDSTGRAAFAITASGNLSLHRPLLAGPVCYNQSPAVAVLSSDGSQLEFATYLSACGAPAVAWSRDGALIAAVSPDQSRHAARLLRLDPGPAPPFALDRIANAFSADARAVVPGGLYTLDVPGLEAPSIDLRINPDQDLPEQLGGVEVTFDGEPAPLLATGPGRVTVVAPATILARSDAQRVPDANPATTVQVFFNGAASNAARMPVARSLPGLLTLTGPSADAPPADANARNEDGSLNAAGNPAPVGSTLTVFLTGIGATRPQVNPGALVTSEEIEPLQRVYPSWIRQGPRSVVVPATVRSVPGFVSALFQARMVVPPDPAASEDIGNGVRRVYLSLFLNQPPPSFLATPISNIVAVYVK